jgi:hypothetical protein
LNFERVSQFNVPGLKFNVSVQRQKISINT